MTGLDLSQIHHSAFSHPYDQKATAALKRVPFLSTLLSKASKLRAEQRFRAVQMRYSIRLGPRQFPSVWRMVNEVAEGFCMPLPTAYISGEGGANAFAFGLEDQSIILTSRLVDLMSDRELEAIIAHELAHVLCQHMLYRQVGLAIAQGTVALNAVTGFAPETMGNSLSMLYFAWCRAAEYSADRAALLFLQDPEAMTTCLGRLAGVPERFSSEFDPRQFAEQIAEHEEESPWWSKIATWDLGLMRTHPEPARRATALNEWFGSEEYQAILDGKYPTIFEVESQERIQIEGVASCPLCRSPVGERSTCPFCGLDQDPARQRHCENGHLVSVEWSFCKSCGHPLES